MRYHKLCLMLCAAIVLGISSSTASIRNTNQLKTVDERKGALARLMKMWQNSRYLPDRVIVKLKSTIGLRKGMTSFGVQSVDAIARRYGVQSVDSRFPEFSRANGPADFDLSHFYVMKFTSPVNPLAIVEELSRLAEVEYAEPWFIRSTDEINACRPDDPNRGVQWGLTKILADSAWCISSGDTLVVIGIVDTGVQLDHVDLSANIWTNPGEIPGNGIDDDGNGYVDDIHGWDFGGSDTAHIVPDNDPSPKSAGAGHGTHVAGIASASTNNGVGVAGVGYRCKILPVKAAIDNDPKQYIDFGMDGILYAARMGAKVINCSWGGGGYSQFEQEIIDSVTARGSIVVASAGNTYDNSIGFPASYRGVMSVGATLNTDARATYSTYNEFVDVSAPGDNIFSTYYPNTYTYMYGTSMAAPHVSGLIGLVRSLFPQYSGLQAGEQVRVTCDDISAQNPGYDGMIGRGRINAVKALTVSSPAIRMVSYAVRDSAPGGNNNRVLEANETFTITTDFLNYLQPTSSSATVGISSTDTNVQILNGTFPIGAIGTLGTSSNVGAPYQVLVKSNPPVDHLVTFKLTMTDGGYADYQYFDVIINQTYSTHDVNDIQVTLTNRGRIGFTDLSNLYGSGFVYGGGNQLYEGGLIVGYSSSKLEDVVRNPGVDIDTDFASSQAYKISTPGSISAQDGGAIFSDTYAPVTNRIGLRVNMSSYAFTSPADRDYVILRYDVTNTSGSAISNFFLGLFFDWDMLPNPFTNKTAFDASRKLGYSWDADAVAPVYCGASLLEGTANYRGLLNSISINLSRSAKWSWISGGVVPMNDTGDVHFVLSSGPFSIPVGGTQTVAFALLGGADLPSLQLHADSALTKWTAIKGLTAVKDQSGSLPKVYALEQNFPNPFNPSTRISYALPKTSHVSLKVFNLLGQEVATLVESEQPAGRYAVAFDGAQLASGMYFYTLRTGEYTNTKKMMIVK